jgi:hypothetical protein
MKKSLIVLLLRSVVWRLTLVWCRSLRIAYNGKVHLERLRSEDKNFVAVFWHGSMMIGWFLLRPSESGIVSALVSRSNDGEFLSTILEKWGFTMIRGSSHIGGAEAMQLMTDAVRSGSSLVVTPDGPRGPRNEMKMGAVRVAQKTGVPLIMIGVASRKKKILRSWDAFEVPFPFSSISAVYSEPIIVPPDLDGAALDAFKLSLQQRLNEMTRQAELIK